MDPNVLSYADRAAPRPPPPPNWLTRVGLTCATTGWALISIATQAQRAQPTAAAWLERGGSWTVVVGFALTLLAVITGPRRRRAGVALAIQFAACLAPIVILGPGD